MDLLYVAYSIFIEDYVDPGKFHGSLHLHMSTALITSNYIINHNHILQCICTSNSNLFVAVGIIQSVKLRWFPPLPTLNQIYQQRERDSPFAPMKYTPRNPGFVWGPVQFWGSIIMRGVGFILIFVAQTSILAVVDPSNPNFVGKIHILITVVTSCYISSSLLRFCQLWSVKNPPFWLEWLHQIP